MVVHFKCDAQTLWTFDCGNQGWGIEGHSNSFDAQFSAPDSIYNSGHLKFTHPKNMNVNWLLGPSVTVDANTQKHIYFDLTLSNAGPIPATGMPAVLSWRNSTGTKVLAGPLSTKTFTIYSGQNNYHIDLSSDPNWTGSVIIDRFSFPSSDQTAIGYNPQTAVYSLNWAALSANSTYAPPVQDNSSSCSLNLLPVATNPTTVVFGNRVSMKVTLNNALASAKMKLWKAGGDTLIMKQVVSDKPAVYFSFFDLDSATAYNWQLELTNGTGKVVTAVQNFNTEAKSTENEPINYWMTPSPFNLAQNPNDDLLDNDTWPTAAGMAQVYKIHGATNRGGTYPEFYRYDFAKLVYNANKHRMRIALEQVISGNKSGQQFADEIIGYINNLASYGGKLEFHTWDGMLFRSFYSTATNSSFRSIDAGMEAVAEATRIVKASYPKFEIIPLPNLPNWDIHDAQGNIVPHNASNWAGSTGVAGWDDLCTIYLNKIAQKGVSIKYIEIDHPYYYYTKSGGRATSARRIKAISDYCISKNIKLIHIINQSTRGDAGFKQGCLDYIANLREDGINPKYVDVESWYPFPNYLTPETRANSFTNVIRDFGLVFNNPPINNPPIIDSNVVLGWRFTNNNEGWSYNPHNTTATWSSGGYLNFSSTGNDPYIYNTTSPTFATTPINYLEVKVKNSTSATVGHIYIFTTTTAPLAIPFSMTPNSTGFETVVVNLSSISGWSNSLSVNNVRIDPNPSGQSGIVSFDQILFLKKNPIQVPIQTISVQGPNTVQLDSTAQMSVVITPINATNKTVTYSVNNTSIATINSSTGILTPFSVGSVTVTATAQDSSGITGSKSVQITGIPIQTISVQGPNTVQLDSTAQMSVVITPQNATNQTVTYSVNNPSIATINASSGILTPVSVGYVTVTATAQDSSGITGSKSIQITGFTIQTILVQGPDTLQLGKTAQMSVVITPQNATNQMVSYSVNDSSIATINANTGVLTPLSIGTVMVTATAQDSSGTTGNKSIKITGLPVVTLGWRFTNNNEGWSYNPHNTTVSWGSGGYLNFSPTGNDPYVYNTTSPTFATTNINYLEVRVKNSTSGTSAQVYIWTTTVGPLAIIIPMTPNSPNYETVVVKLSDVSGWSNNLSVNNVRIDPNPSGQTGTVSFDHVLFVKAYSAPVLVQTIAVQGPNTVQLGSTAQMSVVITPQNATNQTVTYAVNNPSIATINANSGILTPISGGSVTVTATTQDGSGIVGTKVISIPNTIFGWEFTNNVEGWSYNPNNTTVSWGSGGYLNFSPTGNDPYVYNTTSPKFATTNINSLEVRVKNSTSATTAQVYIWTTTIGPLLALVPMTPNNQNYETVVVNLSGVSGWSNNLSVTNVRIDPNNNGQSGIISFDYVRFNNSTANSITQSSIEKSTLNLQPLQGELIIYPNPVKRSEKLNIDLKGAQLNQKTTISIIDLLGRKVYYKETLGEKVISIPTSELQNGFYILNIETKGVIKRFKIIVD